VSVEARTYKGAEDSGQAQSFTLFQNGEQVAERVN